MMKKLIQPIKWVSFLCVTLCLLFFTNTVSGQGTTGSLFGTVKDQKGNPLPYAAVAVENTTKGAISGYDGAFAINGIKNGEYSLRVTYLGYSEQKRQISIKGKAVEMNIILYEDAISVSDIVVYGTLTRGQAKALNEQKNSMNIVNIIDHDQFSKFPDRNAAEALQRIPGVSITRDQGEGEFVLVRGLPPQYSSIQLNGQRIPSPDIADERGAGMGMLLADMMQTIEVSKTSTADMDGDAIGGSVNFKLKSAPDDTYLSVDLQGGYNAQQSKFNEFGSGLKRASIVAADRFMANKQLGLIVSGSYDDNNIGSLLHQYTYEDNSDIITTKRWNDYDVHRRRYGLIVSPDFKFDENNKIRVMYSYNQFDDDEIRRRIDYNYGTLPNKTTIRRETRNRIEKVKTSMFEFSGEHSFSNIKLDYSYIDIKSTMDEPDATNYRFEIKNIDLSSLSNAERTALTGIDRVLPAGSELTITQANTAYEYMSDHDKAARFNLEIPFTLFSKESFVKIGAKWLKKEKEYTNRALTGILDPFGPNRTISDGEFGFVNLKTEDGVGIIPITGFTLNPKTINTANYEAGERVISTYAMGNLKFTDYFTTVVGLRYENTKNDYYHPTTGRKGESSYGNLLPSVNFIFHLTDKSNIKAAFSKGISRPGYKSLVPYYNQDDANKTVSEGNPELKPAFAYSYDLMFERYTKNLGMLTVGAFYKTLKNEISSTVSDITINSEIYRITRPINMGSSTAYGFEVALSQRFRMWNIPFIKDLGIYANYTYTKSESEVDGRKVPMAASPKNIGNISLFYDNEKSGISFAITNVYRSAFILALGDDKYNDVYAGAEYNLDITASKRLYKNLVLKVQVNNITDQMNREYLADPSSSIKRLQQTEGYGRRFIVGLTWKL